MEHSLRRVWNEGMQGNFTYAFRCSCGYIDRGYIEDQYARDAFDEHAEYPA